MVQILLLSGHHNRKAFDCGTPALNAWLASMAVQQQRRGIAVTYVAVQSALTPSIFAYYSISVAELRANEVTQLWRKRLPLKIPVYRLGRLAVALAHQRTGLGRLLLANAISRVSRLASEVGGVGLVVDAKPEALGFYTRYGFEPMADHPGKLFLPLCAFASSSQNI